MNTVATYSLRKPRLYLMIACCYCLQYASAQTNAADNIPTKSISTKGIASGSSVFGVFEGRPPCKEIAKQLHIPISGDCPKLKWRLTFYHDPVTKAPTNYKLEGSFFSEKERLGKWTVLKGMPSNPKAIIIQLDPDKPEDYFYFLKGDNNVLFILDENKNLRVGNLDFSYTLNRVDPKE